jgi:plastocyanin
MKLPVLISLLVTVLAIVAGCTQTAPLPQMPASPTPTIAAVHTPEQPPPSLPVTPLSQSPISANTITIKNFAFDPQSLTVNAGFNVRWENHDNAPHRIVFIDRAGRDTDVDSGVLSPSQSWSNNQFKQPGTYSYYCKIHPEMTGTLIVV